MPDDKHREAFEREFCAVLSLAESYAAHLTRHPEVSEEDVDFITNEMDRIFGYSDPDEKPLREQVHAALTAVWHNRPAQEKAEPVSFQCCEHGYDDWHEIPKESYGINPGRYKYRKLYTAPPAERVRVPDDAEAVSACLGDDAASMLEANPEDERALNMQRAAQIIDAMLSGAPEAYHD